MNLLSIDYGTKNIGLATNNGTEIAFPFSVVENTDSAIGQIADICDEENINTVIIGRPTKMNRAAGVLAEEIKSFAEKIKDATHKPVIFEDEIMSSAMTQKMMADYGGKYQKDAIEAAVILQSYMDRENSSM
jgi:putative Holliday junction resolvase